MAELDGYFVWYELMTTDKAAAEAFYGEVIGWGVEAMEGAPMPYSLWKVEADSVGGCMALSDEMKAEGAKPGWMGYVQVADVDTTVKQAEAAGGSCVSAAVDHPGIGRMATLADPQGGVLTVFKPAQDDMKVVLPPRNGDIGWHELGTTELESAYGFWAGLLGWTVDQDMDMGGGSPYRLFKRGEHGLGGAYLRTPQMPDMPLGWLFYFQVENVDEAVARIEQHGGKKVAGPMPTPGGGRIALAFDPQGAGFAVTGK